MLFENKLPTFTPVLPRKGIVEKLNLKYETLEFTGFDDWDAAHLFLDYLGKLDPLASTPFNSNLTRASTDYAITLYVSAWLNDEQREELLHVGSLFEGVVLTN